MYIVSMHTKHKHIVAEITLNQYS